MISTIRGAYNSLQNFVQGFFPRYGGGESARPYSSFVGPMPQSDSKLYSYIKKQAGQSFLQSASQVATAEMGSLGFFKGVNTSLKGLGPASRLVTTENLAALKSETTRQSILNIGSRNNRFVGEQFALAMNSTINPARLPTPQGLTGTTVAAPTGKSAVSKTYRRLYNPKA